ncbi:MAG: hypothetical protein VX475_20280, partial [Myxococcota bacterium]|nr:hypothetical protein [Myxococcota bacterium]
MAYHADAGGVASEDLGAEPEIDEPDPLGVQRYTITMGEDHILLSSGKGGLVNLFPTLLVIEDGMLPRELPFGTPSLSTREGGFWTIRAEARVG